MVQNYCIIRNLQSKSGLIYAIHPVVKKKIRGRKREEMAGQLSGAVFTFIKFPPEKIRTFSTLPSGEYSVSVPSLTLFL